MLENFFKKFDAYYVGGYVRDFIRGYESSDIDIAVDAALEDFLPFFKNYHPHVIIKYENCSFSAQGKHYSISRMRKDAMCDGRHARIEPVHTIEEDALRRDFTINAIYMTFDGALIDPVHGIQDLKNRIVRFIGDPKKRVKEDQLRILRYFRFCALLGVMLDDDLLKVFEDYCPITTISKERIQEEYQKLLKLNPTGDFLKKAQRFYL